MGKPLVGVVRSCQVASESFDHCSIALLLLSPRAKTAEHLLGVFAFGSKKTGKESMMPPIEP